MGALLLGAKGQRKNLKEIRKRRPTVVYSEEIQVKPEEECRTWVEQLIRALIDAHLQNHSQAFFATASAAVRAWIPQRARTVQLTSIRCRRDPSKLAGRDPFQVAPLKCAVRTDRTAEARSCHDHAVSNLGKRVGPTQVFCL